MQAVDSPEKLIVSSAQQLSAKRADRMDWIDYAKGFAIILVVFRHAVVGFERAGLEVPTSLFNIQEFFFNFRMPVFFILSGIFLQRAVSKMSPQKMLKKKVTTLLYPYFLWTTVFITLQIVLSDYTNATRSWKDYAFILTQPRNLDHMWYLLALFNTNVLFILLHKLNGKYRVVHLFISVALHLISYVVRDYSLFSDLLYHYIFLFIGTAVSDLLFRQDVEGGLTKKSMIAQFMAMLPVFVAGQLLWLTYKESIEALLLPNLVIILIASYTFYLFVKLMWTFKVFTSLTIIGRHSLYIYILHLFVISAFRIICMKVFGVENVYLLVMGSLILGLTIPVIFFKLTKNYGASYLFSLEKPRQRL
ncbi:MAG: acyltransferase [Sphingobacteriales bacterium]|nr:MAG: acyltransferase [Sphingobacteriales bacterium]